MSNKSKEIKIFFMFLKKLNVFDEFVCNSCSFNHEEKSIEFVKSVLRGAIIDEFTFCPFSWLDSQEGFDFWKEVDKNWQHCIHEHKLIKE